MKHLIDNNISKKISQATDGKNQEDKLAMWNDIKKKMKVGDMITGVIFYKAPFGVFLDVNLAFPAILRIVDIIGLDYDLYQKNEIFKLGAKIKVNFVNMGDEPDKIDVRQID